METYSNLDDQTVSELKDLIKANADSARIFRDAAKETEKTTLSALFQDIAAKREVNARQLQSALQITGEPTDIETSLTQPLRSWWMKVRDTIQSDEEVGILSSLESQEDKMLASYKDTLTKTAGSPLNAELHSQLTTVKEHHDRIRDLRDAAKARS